MKTQWNDIFIEANEEQARKVFTKKFKLDPDHVTCECCGPDFWIDPYPPQITNLTTSLVILEAEVKEILNV